MKRYEIRLPYALSATLAAAFPEFDAVQLAPSTTVLTGMLHDQAELHGILTRIADMGLEIAEVHVRDEPS
ncbi:hypothetical protein [Paeniglutamicibacter cryotolerans]|uniref:NIL domain-containing protein n=1 Tax=Paeniglutamicibacter cryotolerans TaxID=670079 RepID=A0A839QI71_9MICC|nr:hypothetical protein [Paeniglutamicibacter cryotolerans]MBB2995477.1 hypothetical protein [Paeniglutamicibacter cryotolerans]